jgi:hypothetical protein
MVRPAVLFRMQCGGPPASIAAGSVSHIDLLFAIERDTNGASPVRARAPGARIRGLSYAHKYG